jgi:hypothetical protein
MSKGASFLLGSLGFYKKTKHQHKKRSALIIRKQRKLELNLFLRIQREEKQQRTTNSANPRKQEQPANRRTAREPEFREIFIGDPEKRNSSAAAAAAAAAWSHGGGADGTRRGNKKMEGKTSWT